MLLREAEYAGQHPASWSKKPTPKKTGEMTQSAMAKEKDVLHSNHSKLRAAVRHPYLHVDVHVSSGYQLAKFPAAASQASLNEWVL